MEKKMETNILGLGFRRTGKENRNGFKASGLGFGGDRKDDGHVYNGLSSLGSTISSIPSFLADPRPVLHEGEIPEEFSAAVSRRAAATKQQQQQNCYLWDQ